MADDRGTEPERRLPAYFIKWMGRPSRCLRVDKPTRARIKYRAVARALPVEREPWANSTKSAMKYCAFADADMKRPATHELVGSSPMAVKASAQQPTAAAQTPPGAGPKRR